MGRYNGWRDGQTVPVHWFGETAIRADGALCGGPHFHSHLQGHHARRRATPVVQDIRVNKSRFARSKSPKYLNGGLEDSFSHFLEIWRSRPARRVKGDLILTAPDRRSRGSKVKRFTPHARRCRVQTSIGHVSHEGAADDNPAGRTVPVGPARAATPRGLNEIFASCLGVRRM